CPPRRLGVALKTHCRQRQLLHPQPYATNPPTRYDNITAAVFFRGSLMGQAAVGEPPEWRQVSAGGGHSQSELRDLPPVAAHSDKAKVVRAHFVGLRVIEVALETPQPGLIGRVR